MLIIILQTRTKKDSPSHFLVKGQYTHSSLVKVFCAILIPDFYSDAHTDHNDICIFSGR